MNKPQHVNSLCAYVWLRADISREDGKAYWRGTHGQIANKLPSCYEYRQHHFSETDHGFWPVPEGIGGITPPDWKMDGIAELRISNMLRSVYDRIFNVKAIFHDEFNVFDRVVPNTTRLGGGRWYTGDHQPDIGFRAAVFIRARYQYRGAPFTRFLNGTLAPAFIAAGVQELRTYDFAPGGRFASWTPDVDHSLPRNRAYAGALIIGVRSREELNRVLASPQLQATQELQRHHCVAIHSYAVANTYAPKLAGVAQPQTWP
jgi:hypothetical protein